MGRQFAIYTRASEEGSDGTLSSNPAEQETAARAWAERAGVEVVDVVDEVASGGLSAADRKLGQLIDRCESGDLDGIIVRFEDRFARDVVAGGVALARMNACGARLVATATGFDSAELNSQSQMMFNIVMAVGQAQRERNLEARKRGKERFAERGGYAAVAPFGYDRDADGRLVANGDAEAVREIFRLRAEGRGFSDIAGSVRLTRSGVRRVVMNRAYVGEQRIPGQRKGDPRVIANSHLPLVTEQEWEAANAVRGRPPIRRGLGAHADLKGIVRCGNCGSTMHVLAYGKPRVKLTYACTKSGCGGAAMAVRLVEPAVLWQLDLAVMEREPHVAAVIEGDNRYSDALAAVEDAQRTLAEYRDSPELQRALGLQGFAEGLAVRREAVETARRALRGVPRPDALGTRLMTLPEADADDRRRFYRRAIAEVLVYPRSAVERLTLRWQGSEEAMPVPALGAAEPLPSHERAVA